MKARKKIVVKHNYLRLKYKGVLKIYQLNDFDYQKHAQEKSPKQLGPDGLVLRENLRGSPFFILLIILI